MPVNLHWREIPIENIVELSRAVRLFAIKNDATLGMYSPGAHIQVRVAINGRPDTRTYSLIPGSDSATLRFAVKIDPKGRGGSRYLWGLSKGDRIDVSEICNEFHLSHGKPAYLLLAGGIGITPVIGMAQALAAKSANYRLLYICRSRADVLFADALEELSPSVRIHLSSVSGRFELKRELSSLQPGAEIYVCGPQPMMTEARRAWQDSGRAQTGFHLENFGTGSEIGTFTVFLKDLGKRLAIPSGVSMLDALLEAGVDMNYQCRKGECGLCAVEVDEASAPIVHRDFFFSASQKQLNQRMCTCVSRAAAGSEITVDTFYRKPAAID